MTRAIVPPAFTDDALCRQTDPDAFYPEPMGATTQVAAAKRICAACPVRAECLAWALDQHGIWGGLTPTERRRLATRRGAAA